MSNRKIIFGLILILVGLLLMGRTFDLFHFGFGDAARLIFPVGLIVVGVWMMLRRRAQERAEDHEMSFSVHSHHDTGRTSPQPEPIHSPEQPEPPPFGRRTSDSDLGGPQGVPRVSQSPEQRAGGKLRYSKFIGDMFVDCNGLDLQSMEINNFLGDVEIKLHGGKLAPGLNRMIISGFIGDVRVLVPHGMAVFAQSSNFIGDIEMMGRRSSGVSNSLDAQTPNYAQSESKLYVASNHFIGDVRVYVV